MRADERIRVLLAERSHAVRELVGRTLTPLPEFDLVGECFEPIELLLALREGGADVVVLGVSAAGDRLCAQLFSHFPELIVLRVAPDAAAVFVDRVRLHRRKFRLSDVHLPDVIRQTLRQARQFPGAIDDLPPDSR